MLNAERERESETFLSRSEIVENMVVGAAGRRRRCFPMPINAIPSGKCLLLENTFSPTDTRAPRGQTERGERDDIPLGSELLILERFFFLSAPSLRFALLCVPNLICCDADTRLVWHEGGIVSIGEARPPMAKAKHSMVGGSVGCNY